MFEFLGAYKDDSNILKLWRVVVGTPEKLYIGLQAEGLALGTFTLHLTHSFLYHSSDKWK